MMSMILKCEGVNSMLIDGHPLFFTKPLLLGFGSHSQINTASCSNGVTL